MHRRCDHVCKMCSVTAYVQVQVLMETTSKTIQLIELQSSKTKYANKFLVPKTSVSVVF